MIRHNAAHPFRRHPHWFALRPHWLRSATVLAALLVASSAAPSANAAGGRIHDLKSCQRLAESSPTEALVEVQTWIEHGGGEDARICRAAAQFQAGDFANAGRGFETLASDSVGRNATQIANLYDRAAWAWLRAGDNAQAERLYTLALDKQPDDGEIRIDRGIARAEARRFREAIDDFTAVLKRQPRRTDAAFYRATAYRAVGDLRNAEADVEQVLRLKPDSSEALVLRGTLRALRNDIKGAQLDWREVIRREPDSANGRTAAANLAHLSDAQKPEAESKTNARPAR